MSGDGGRHGDELGVGGWGLMGAPASVEGLNACRLNAGKSQSETHGTVHWP